MELAVQRAAFAVGSYGLLGERTAHAAIALAICCDAIFALDEIAHDLGITGALVFPVLAAAGFEVEGSHSSILLFQAVTWLDEYAQVALVHVALTAGVVPVVIVRAGIAGPRIGVIRVMGCAEPVVILHELASGPHLSGLDE